MGLAIKTSLCINFGHFLKQFFKKMKNILAILAIGMAVCQAVDVREGINAGIDAVEAGLNRLTACVSGGHVTCTAFCKVYYKQPVGVCKFNKEERKDECHCEGEKGTRSCLTEETGTACKILCKATGLEDGNCNEKHQCVCSDVKSKWGHTQDKIVDFGEGVVDFVGDFFG